MTQIMFKINNYIPSHYTIFASCLYLYSNICFLELDDTTTEEQQTCESPEPMSYYLHHDPDHPMSSFSVINKMRVNIQVRF